MSLAFNFLYSLHIIDDIYTLTVHWYAYMQAPCLWGLSQKKTEAKYCTIKQKHNITQYVLYMPQIIPTYWHSHLSKIQHFSEQIFNSNLLGDDIETIKKNTQTLIDAGKEVGLDVNTEKTKYMLLSRHQNAGQNHDIKIANRSFESVAPFKYFRTVTNQNLIQEEMKMKLS
jgi:hypothetical protein